jgi:transcriptional regulator with GAF, ATPase, and Fis domain
VVDYLRLSEVMIESSRCLIAEQGVEQTLDLLCRRVGEVLPVRGTGVMLADDRGELRFVAASDDVLCQIESLQIELGEGPCLRAYRTGEQVLAIDLLQSGDFPRFGPRAVDKGLRAVYSFPMTYTTTCIGALNLYGELPVPFDAEDVVVGQALADLATALVLNLRTVEQASLLNRQLQGALDTRVVIEQAKGRLSEQLGVDIEKAFDRLRRYARGRGLRLRDVAERIVIGDLRLEEAEAEAEGV